MWITSTVSYSQLLPVGYIPMKHNGSFAGMSGQGRLTMNLNREFNSSTYKKNGLYVSYDDFIERLSTGIALTTYHYKYEQHYEHSPFIDSASIDSDSLYFVDKSHKGNYIELAIAPKISVKGKYTISPSIKIKYGVGYDRLSRNEVLEYDQGFNHVDITGGLTINTPKYYIGYAVRLFSKGGANFLPAYTPEWTTSFYSVLEAGYSFHRKDENSKFSFTLQAAFHIASNTITDNLQYKHDINLRFQYSQLIYGHSFTSISSFSSPQISSHPGYQLLSYLGWQKDNFRGLVMLSFYDNVDIHLNFRFIIPHKDKNRGPMFF